MIPKYLIGLAALGFIVMAFVARSLVLSGPNEFSPIANPETDVLRIDNAGGANFDVVFGSTRRITVEFADGTNPPRRRFFKTDGNTVLLEMSDDWKNKVKRVIVPQGVLIDVRSNTALDVDRSGNARSSFLVDTSQLNKVTFNGDTVSTQGWGRDDNTFDPLPETPNSDQPSPDSVCAFGTQSVRNYCCTQNHGGSSNGTNCSHGGMWTFNNALLLCQYQCASPDEDEEEESCNVGVQALKNACCASQNAGVAHDNCDGSWVYSSQLSICQYQCYSQQNAPIDQSDAVSQYCSAYSNTEEKNACCNDSLGNALSTGPRPGFPDCIGKWDYSAKDGCAFRCADYGEKIEIYREIKQQLGQ